MKSIKQLFLLSILIISTQTFAFAGAGETGLGFLTLGQGARGTAMGEAQTAVAKGADAVYWNPAGLGLTQANEISLTYLQHFEDATQQYASLALPLKKSKWGGLGFSVNRFGVEDIQARDAANNVTGTVEEEDLSLQLSYGMRIGRRTNTFQAEGLFFGLGVKQISQKLAGVSASAFGLDVGAQYKPGSKLVDSVGEWARRTSLGVSVTNIGNGPEFDREETPLPQATQFGLGYTHFLWGDALNLAVDFKLPRDDDSQISAGCEFWIKSVIAARVGYIAGQEEGDEIRAGAGFRFQTLQLDYAWAGFGDTLGDTHRISLSLLFGEGAVRLKEGLKKDLIDFHLSEAQDALNSQAYHKAVLEANKVLEVDSRNPQALQILIEAGEQLKPEDPLPEPEETKENQTQEEITPGE